jgi:hypothetical protein
MTAFMSKQNLHAHVKEIRVFRISNGIQWLTLGEELLFHSWIFEGC